MKPAARVVPNVPSFAVDAGFWYSIPDHLVADIEVGRIVRVPLSGRRVRGWVVEVGQSDSNRLKDIAGVSGNGPVFDQGLLTSLLWASTHYVAPVSSLLSRATPPNLPGRLPSPVVISEVSNQHPIADIALRTAKGRRAPVTTIIGNWRDHDWIGGLGPVLNQGRSVLIVAASVAEVEMLAAAARVYFGDAVSSVRGADDASDTTAWEEAQTPPRVVIGTPKVASWLITSLGMAVVLEENRRAMKDRQTPTIHVRDLMATRSRVETFNLVFFGPTPGVELLASGAEVRKVGARAWPLVEVVDRSEERGSYLSGRTMAALEGMVARGRRVFVFTHRRVDQAATRCASCRALRVCESCHSKLGRVEVCPKCQTQTGPCSQCGSAEFEELGTVPDRLVREINRRSGAEIAAVHPSDKGVTVGTERDLAGLGKVALAISSDVDGMLIGGGYRTSEEALRQLARIAITVEGGSGARLLLQTTQPEHPLITTMRRGDPMPYLERVLVARGKERMPPSTEMIAVEIRGDGIDEVDLGDLEGDVEVLGPLTIDDGRRWLLIGKLGKARQQLRTKVGKWRDSGATVRVDVDPIDV